MYEKCNTCIIYFRGHTSENLLICWALSTVSSHRIHCIWMFLMHKAMPVLWINQISFMLFGSLFYKPGFQQPYYRPPMELMHAIPAFLLGVAEHLHCFPVAKLPSSITCIYSAAYVDDLMDAFAQQCSIPRQDRVVVPLNFCSLHHSAASLIIL